MSPTVLVIGAGHDNALGLMRALQGESLTLLACDENPKAAGLRMLPEDRRFVVHASDSRELIGDLLSLCVSRRVDLLVATDARDVPALLSSRSLFEQLGTRVWCDPARAVGRSVSARKITDACQPSALTRAIDTVTTSASRLWRAIGPGAA